ncbi:MAG: hypothetical protein E7455_05590, partial [Ruminococcaceae bacterium]|nr:hypothetical protein [Oscillospiraceae bacterium]
MRTVNHYTKRILALLMVCALCINLFAGAGLLQRVAAEETAASGVDLMNSASFTGVTGVLSYDVDKKTGWIGGNGTTASTAQKSAFFTYNTFGDVIVDGEEVALTSREITYSVTFSDFTYNSTTYPNGVRQEAVVLHLQYTDSDSKEWNLYNRFGAQKYGSGHYMQIGSTGSTLLAANAGAPFYSESVKNSIANFPALASGDTISMKVKCATDTENGYIKLLLNGEEKHSFVYTGTTLPQFGLKSMNLMAKISNISLAVDGATGWSQCTNHVEGEQIIDAQPGLGVEGSWHTECTNCGQTINSGTIPALVGMELIDENACLSNQKVGVLTYDVNAKEGWIGGDGTTLSTDVPERYFSFDRYADVMVDGAAVPYGSREVTYSVTFSDFTYDTSYTYGVRSQGVILMLLYKDADGNTWKLENRFGAKGYGSGQYMQVWQPGKTVGSGSTLLAANAGAPFYSESVKNSVSNFPALANGDTITLKVKGATDTENGYIKLLLNGTEWHSFVFTGTNQPDFGLKAFKLMAKTSNASLFVDGATGWADCACDEPVVEEYDSSATCPEGTTLTGKCTVCGNRVIKVIEPTDHTVGETVIENEKAADCVNPGSYESVVYCVYCGEEVSRETVVTEALGHAYDNDCDADCNNCGETREAGHQYYYPCDPVCMICYEITNPDAAHNVIAVEAVEATCVADG